MQSPGYTMMHIDTVIDAVDQVVDQTDYSIKVYASVNEFQEEFRPGMYVRARFAD